MERHRDPLELWVGTWTPEELAKRETRKAEERKTTEEPSPEADVGKRE
ncbi:MAG: hypothetical protein ACRDFA_06345 [bacterium]